MLVAVIGGEILSKAGSYAAVTLAARATAVLTAGALSVTALAGCSSDAKPKAVVKASTSAPTTVAPTKRPVVPKPRPIHPLTGVGRPPTGPVVAVKIDDTAAGRPSLGLEKADVIYVEEVEGGLTRMVGIFAGSKPKVMAVRSVRPSDPELLAQYGRIILVASGGAGASLAALDGSILHGVIGDRGQVGFFRDQSRPAPYNMVSDLSQVSRAIKASGVRNVGFSWSARDPRLARAPSAGAVNTQVGGTRVSFVWYPKQHRYIRTIDGQRVVTASGAAVAKPNVLVQFCQVRVDYSDVDVNRNPSMYTESVGSGRVVLFRGGKKIEGRWSRPKLWGPTVFKDLKGKPLLLAPGGTFVALARPGASV